MKRDIGPRQQELVAKLKLLKNWKLKSKFRFTLKNPPIEMQKEIIRKSLGVMKEKIDTARKSISTIPFSLLPIELCQSKIAESGMQSFVDLEFEPNDHTSVYDIGIDSPYDVIIHWRRPSEFMKTDYNEGLAEPSVFYDSIEPNDIKIGVLGDEWFLSALAVLAERPTLIERLFITKEF